MAIVDADDLPESFVRALYGLGADVVVWSRPDAIAIANNDVSSRKKNGLQRRASRSARSVVEALNRSPD